MAIHFKHPAILLRRVVNQLIVLSALLGIAAGLTMFSAPFVGAFIYTALLAVTSDERLSWAGTLVTLFAAWTIIVIVSFYRAWKRGEFDHLNI